jgi:hypothetical protein
MALEALVASVITILSPYLAAGAKKAAEVTGEAVAKQAGQLLGRIRTWFAGDTEATSALQNFEQKPGRYSGTLEDILLEKAKNDPAIADELKQLIDSMGPRVEVFQKMRTLAGEATGLDLAAWEKGVAKSHQEVDVVEKGATLTGAKIGKF